jgi:hypothetical protein
MNFLVQYTHVFSWRANISNYSYKGICRSCRGKISNINEKLPCVEESATECTRKKRTGTHASVYTTVDVSPVHQNPSPYVEPDTPGYQPQLSLPARSNTTSDKKKLEELNNLLRERDFKREHLRKINQGVQAVMGPLPLVRKMMFGTIL